MSATRCRFATSRTCCTNGGSTSSMKRCGSGGTGSARCSRQRSQKRCVEGIRSHRRRSHLNQGLVEINTEQHYRRRAVDNEGDGEGKYAGWISVAFVSDGIQNQFHVNKINNLRPREGSLAVAFPPPFALQESFSPSGYGGNFPLFSRVMRVRLSTGPGARRLGSGL